jgi:hypothetical protein
MFSTFDCAVKGFRQKEDAWNAIISGFMTGGCLAARSESLFFLHVVSCRGGLFPKSMGSQSAFSLSTKPFNLDFR